MKTPDQAIDQRRFRLVIEQHRGRIRRAVARCCRGRLSSYVDDVEQEVILKLWKALESEKKIDNLASYVHRVAATTAIDALRRLRADRERPLPESDTNQLGGVVTTGPTPEKAAESKELLTKASEVLSRLPANRRTAVGLYLQGFSLAEIAEMADWTEAKARNLVYRGLDELRRELSAMGIAYETD